MTATFPALHRRPRRRVPATIAAVGLFGVGGLLVWAAGQQLATQTWPGFAARLTASLTTSAWTSPLGWGLAIGFVLVGLVLVAVALTPGHARSIPLAESSAAQVRAGAAYLTYGGLARLAAVQARDIDGADDVRATAVGRRLRVVVITPLTDTAALAETVRTSVQTRLGQSGVAPAPRIDVRVRHREVRT